MKTIIFALFATSSVAFSMGTDSLERAVVQIINQERRAIGVDTLQYQFDTFGFAKDWADSTNQYFHVEGHEFSRPAAHRNFSQRYDMYVIIGKIGWKYFGECLVTGKIKLNDEYNEVVDFTKSLLKSKDHYDVLMKIRYEKIIIGISTMGEYK